MYKIANGLILFVVVQIFFSAFWIYRYFGVVSIDSLVATFHLGFDSFSSDFIVSFIKFSVVVPAFFLGIMYFAHRIRTAGRPMLGTAIMAFLIPCGILFFLKVGTNFFRTNVESGIAAGTASIYDSYLEPTILKPNVSQLRNLIWIYVESLERDYVDVTINKELDISTNFMQDLMVKPLVNKYTAGAIFSMRCGAPLFLETFIHQNTLVSSPFKNANCVDDILRRQGYNSYFVLPHDPNFSGLGNYFKFHADADVSYPNTVVNRHKSVHAILADEVIFDEASIRLASKSLKEPFALTLLTAGNHAPRGFPSTLCKEQYGDKISGVIKCNNQQLIAFIKAFQKSTYAKNTVLVITGDHPFMGSGPEFSVNRSVFAKIFVPEPEKRLLRNTVTQFDFFPTILSGLGFPVGNSRVGFGFSAFDTQRYPDSDWVDKITEMNYRKPPRAYFDLH